MKSHGLAALWLGMCVAGFARADTTIDLTTARLELDGRGVVEPLRFADGTSWPGSRQPAFALETAAGTIAPRSVRRTGEVLSVVFDDGAKADFRVSSASGVALFRLVNFQPVTKVERFRLFSLVAPEGARAGGTLNRATAGGWDVAVMAAEPNVEARTETTGGSRADRPGCRHRFSRSSEARVGRGAGEFTATSDSKPNGWSMRGRAFDRPLDLIGCRAIRAWVEGDGQGEQLKIQLYDGAGGYRDNYIPIDFKGWRQVTLTDSPINTLRYDRVSDLNFYYNGLPAGRTVSCKIDRVEAVLARPGGDEVVVLEDFETSNSPLWAEPSTALTVATSARHGLSPAAFGVIAVRSADFWPAVERFESAAGIPAPRLGGAWNKQSAAVKRSYFFLTDFRASQYDDALAIARRGGFSTILLGQESWARGTGHYEVDRERFPGGLDGLRQTIDRFHGAGFGVGLHFLGPSVYPPDPYITPVPEHRLVTGPSTTLAADIDAKASFLPTVAPPSAFPAADGGYEGDGSVLRVGDELISYGSRSLTDPAGFRDCRRGHLGTRAMPHRKGERVAHLSRSYGYHLFDMDTTLLGEVAANFARVADTCGIDMVYFDGSERLQGDHWYYNARLHKAFVDALRNRNLLLQASSYSHYSWHLLARSASADGHGDLKGYLDERSPGFDSMSGDGMPLDIGWYYGYDPESTLDQYEYVLGATVGYDSSMSFQVSVAAAARHPFTGPLLDLIARYERLRLSGRVPPDMKARLRIDASQGGPRPEAERDRRIESRREYRLVGPEGREAFQRVVYMPWHEGRADTPATWTETLANGPARLGAWVHARPGPWLAPGPSYDAAGTIRIEAFDTLAPYASAAPRGNPRRIAGREGGSVLPGVTQSLELADDEPRVGRKYVVYSAESSLTDSSGWSAIGRSFDAPIDLSRSRGIGFWMRGDGRGGQLKLQLRDDRGACDHYIPNDFKGWRYQQLERPAPDPIDYARVRSLTWYYNGLPAKSTVRCGIADVRALPALDLPGVTDPWVELGGRRLLWKGTLLAGQYLVFWPEGKVVRYGPPLREPESSSWSPASIEAPSGPLSVHFGSDGKSSLPVRVRVMAEPRERHEIPPPR